MKHVTLPRIPIGKPASPSARTSLSLAATSATGSTGACGPRPAAWRMASANGLTVNLTDLPRLIAAPQGALREEAA